MLTAGAFAQFDNTTNLASNDTMSSNTTGTTSTAATDTNQTIDQLAQQISKNGAEGGAVKQVLAQIAMQVDTAGGDSSQVINQLAKQVSEDKSSLTSQAIIQLAKQSSANTGNTDQAITQIAQQISSANDSDVTQKIVQVAIQVAANDVNINQRIDQTAKQAVENNATAQQEVKQLIQQIALWTANQGGDVAQTVDLVDRIVIITGENCVAALHEMKTNTASDVNIITPQIEQKITLVSKQIAIQNVEVNEVNVKQIITQIAIQIANGGGNASQAITQIANQVALEGQGGHVKQFIKQLAIQQAAGNSNVNQTITQIANQTVSGSNNNVVQVIIQIAQQQTATTQNTVPAQNTTTSGKTDLEKSQADNGLDGNNSAKLGESGQGTVMEDKSETNSTDDGSESSNDTG
jgi:hypothetical protein